MTREEAVQFIAEKLWYSPDLAGQRITYAFAEKLVNKVLDYQQELNFETVKKYLELSDD